MSEIDVTKCEYYCKGRCLVSEHINYDIGCHANNCYFKQLQQLKVEKEYEKTCKEDFQDKWNVLYDENEKLKEEIDGLKRNILEKENCSPRYYLVTTHREWNELYKKFNYQREQKNKYKQCLDEIEEIILKRQKEHYCYCDECSPFKEILQLIKQVEESYGNN